jgi:hypothetical protein
MEVNTTQLHGFIVISIQNRKSISQFIDQDSYQKDTQKDQKV